MQKLFDNYLMTNSLGLIIATLRHQTVFVLDEHLASASNGKSFRLYSAHILMKLGILKIRL